MNTRIEFGSAWEDPRWENGRGRVFIEVDSASAFSIVNYDDRYLISGKLEMDRDFYVTADTEPEGKYPTTTNRLLINRFSGEGYFQSSTYKDANTLPDYFTESLESCKPIKKRF